MAAVLEPFPRWSLSSIDSFRVDYLFRSPQTTSEYPSRTFSTVLGDITISCSALRPGTFDGLTPDVRIRATTPRWAHFHGRWRRSVQ